MCSTHRAIGETPADRDDLYVGVVVADIVSDLFQAAQGRKIGNRISKGDLTAERHSCCHPGHVLFGHARIEKLTRQLLHEWSDYAESKITHDQNDAVVLLGQLKQFAYER